VEVNVFDGSDPEQSAAYETFVKSLAVEDQEWRRRLDSVGRPSYV
jgi:hypothetical protein